MQLTDLLSKVKLITNLSKVLLKFLSFHLQLSFQVVYSRLLSSDIGMQISDDRTVEVPETLDLTLLVNWRCHFMLAERIVRGIHGRLHCSCHGSLVWWPLICGIDHDHAIVGICVVSSLILLYHLQLLLPPLATHQAHWVILLLETLEVVLDLCVDPLEYGVGILHEPPIKLPPSRVDALQVVDEHPSFASPIDVLQISEWFESKQLSHLDSCLSLDLVCDFSLDPLLASFALTILFLHGVKQSKPGVNILTYENDTSDGVSESLFDNRMGFML